MTISLQPNSSAFLFSSISELICLPQHLTLYTKRKNRTILTISAILFARIKKMYYLCIVIPQKYSNIWSKTPEFTYIYGFVKPIMQLLTI